WYTAVPCCASSRTRRLHDAHPILAPDARVRGEVALEVAPAVRVIPEKERHGRHGPCEDQFAHLVNDGPAMLVVRLHLGSQRPARSEEHTSELQSRENLVCRHLPGQ